MERALEFLGQKEEDYGARMFNGNFPIVCFRRELEQEAISFIFPPVGVSARSICVSLCNYLSVCLCLSLRPTAFLCPNEIVVKSVFPNRK